ncbi:MAG: BlaI/MecI/CopY family transcriptional regulator [Gemmatimonadota bacterium]|nr:BlaI/MecI/CopY family transcriptional regulator [Gemmatimonadota bacterium]
MAKKRRLAEVEWEVMDGVWNLNRQVTVRDVVNHLYPNGEKAYTTVQTIMNILAEKGVLAREKIGPVNVYRPAVTRGDVARTETRTLVSRMFEGSFGALATYLVDSGELSRKELDELRALIEEREKAKEGGPM